MTCPFGIPNRAGQAVKVKQPVELNRTLDKINVSINAKYREILDSKGSVTAHEVKTAFQGMASEQETLIDYFTKLQIIPFNEQITLDKTLQKPFYNKAEGHNINYRLYYKKIEIEGSNFILMARTAMIEDHDLLMILAVQYGLLFFILIIGLTIIQRLISKKLWSPFYESLEKIEKFNLETGLSPTFEKRTPLSLHG